MKLELKHLAPYLPYGLKIFNHYTGSVEELICVSNFYTQERKTSLSGGVCILNVLMSNVRHKPSFRPLSDLTKEIEHNGECFIPLEEVFHLIFGGIGDVSIQYKNSNIIKVSDSTDVLTVWLDTLCFQSWGIAPDGESTWSQPFNQYDVIQKLLEWHFDVFGLIESGLAVDINALKK